MIFTGSDKSLLDRTARRLSAEADGLGWESVVDKKERKRVKLEFDRLKRDERDGDYPQLDLRSGLK